MRFLSAKLYIQLLSLDKSTGPLIGVSFISHDDESKYLLIWNVVCVCACVCVCVCVCV